MSDAVTYFQLTAIDEARWRDQVTDAYSDSMVQSLFEKRPALNGVSPAELQAILVSAGVVYLGEKAIIELQRTEMPDWRDKALHRAQLAQIAKGAAQIQSRLALLEKPAADLMWLPTRGPIKELISSNPSQFGEQIATRNEGETVPAFLLNEKHLLQALKVLEYLAADARNAIPKDSGGRPEHAGLRRWVQMMHAFWTENLGQSFRLTLSPMGASPAVRFFVAALTPIDTAIDEAAIHAAMRAWRDELKRPGAKPGQLAKTLNRALGTIPIHID